MLNMLKIVEGALKKEKDSVLLECLKKWIKRIKVLSLKQKTYQGHQKRQGHLSSLWKERTLDKELQGIPCNYEGKET